VTSRLRPFAAGAIALLLSGCSMPAALTPGGPQAGAISGLIWSFTGLLTVIWILVLVALGIAIFRGHKPRPDPVEASPRTERRVSTIIGVLGGITGVIVIGLTVLSYAAQQQIYAPATPALTIEVIGHQWWWELKYDDPDPSKTFNTANEIHVPVGQLVELTLKSDDVIHSFWVPSLMGKTDLIPGRTNSLRFTADKAGVYGGQCAEFCGLQHAHMGMRVFVDAPAEFDRWKAGQIAPSVGPTTPAQSAGQTAFLNNPCLSCHAIRGTTAGGVLGPDLTHVASRSTLAAGTLPFTRGTLAAWITDPQSIKPGTNMPTIKLEPQALNAMLDYLTGLK
jgi:cytochrome c oxidase subunit 2